MKLKTDHCSKSLVIKIRRKIKWWLKAHFESTGHILFLDHKCVLFAKCQWAVDLMCNFMCANYISIIIFKKVQWNFLFFIFQREREIFQCVRKSLEETVVETKGVRRWYVYWPGNRVSSSFLKSQKRMGFLGKEVISGMEGHFFPLWLWENIR